MTFVLTVIGFVLAVNVLFVIFGILRVRRLRLAIPPQVENFSGNVVVLAGARNGARKLVTSSKMLNNEEAPRRTGTLNE